MRALEVSKRRDHVFTGLSHLNGEQTLFAEAPLELWTQPKLLGGEKWGKWERLKIEAGMLVEYPLGWLNDWYTDEPKLWPPV